MRKTEVPSFYAVRVGSHDEEWTVQRFAPTETGEKRANEYAEAYNKSLCEAMGLTGVDLSMPKPNWLQRSHEYEVAAKVDRYRMESATVGPYCIGPIVGDDDPMPTDYPHNF